MDKLGLHSLTNNEMDVIEGSKKSSAQYHGIEEALNMRASVSEGLAKKPNHFTLTKYWVIIFCLLPIVYIWSLPTLYKMGYAYKGYVKKEDLTYSVSAFITEN
jgi:hypothetical protein